METFPFAIKKRPAMIEPLEARIAPALLNEAGFVSVAAGSKLLLQAGQGLSTSDAGGAYLLYVEEGQALVFTSDFNKNDKIDFNEITGIAAGDGLSLLLFSDLHGDIVTNLKADGTLTDSDNNPANGRDGLVLLDSSIKKIEVRALAGTDIENPGDLSNRLAYTTFSIFGDIFVGGDLGVAPEQGQPAQLGLKIDTSGEVIVRNKYDGSEGTIYPATVLPTMGSVRTGTEAGSSSMFEVGEVDPYRPFSFQIDAAPVLGGVQVFGGPMTEYIPIVGEAGGSVYGYSASGPAQFDGVIAGNGGFGAAGGNIQNVSIKADNVGGYRLIAGDGGSGLSGGAGGSVLDYSDVGSITGPVQILAGDGGNGQTGAGGAGGAVSLGDMSMAAGLDVIAGSGGDGFTQGGNGQSILSGNFTFPEEIDFAVGLETRSSTRSALSIGETSGADFNGDGFGDVVFTTEDPDQTVVLLGDGFGSFSQRLDLLGVIDPGALVIADFDNDGLSDIAVATNGNSSLPEIRTYLSRVDMNGDLAFSRPLYSTLPWLVELLYAGGQAPINAMTAGDFNGDGLMDLAVNSLQTGLFTDDVHNVVIVLEGLDGNGDGNGDGFFAADFGPNGGPARIPYFFGGDASEVVLRSTVMAAGANDSILFGAVGDVSITVLSYDDISGMGLPVSVSLGQVDTNREVGADKITLEDVKLADFDVFDFGSVAGINYNSDGDADVAVLLGEPGTNFLVFIENDGVGGLTVATGASGDQAGLILGDDLDFKALETVDADGDGQWDDVALWQLSDDATSISEYTFDLVGPGPLALPNFSHSAFSSPHPVSLGEENVVEFDVWMPDLGTPTSLSYSVLDPVVDTIGFDVINFTGDSGFNLEPYTHYSIDLVAGDGGDSTIGSGGHGGGIGEGAIKGNPSGALTAAITVTLAEDDEVLGADSTFQAGSGGDGLINGGNGGNISGVLTLPGDADVAATDFTLIAGNAGDGLLGNGGNGGGISGSSIFSGRVFVAGNGGTGTNGGNGGSAIGNGLGVRDTWNGDVLVIAGDGGDGAKRGGNGGGIISFLAEIPSYVALAGGALTYQAGDGGDAVTGSGGSGGSVTDSSPSSDLNSLAEAVSVMAGHGGNGGTGGAGGSIINFINAPTVGDVPTAFELIAGNGGKGIKGKGGAGGSISSSGISGSGVDPLFSNFGRIVAGVGGDSSGGDGGKGGDISGIKATAQSSPIALAAGAGGFGLKKGGQGGAVMNTSANASAILDNKVLVIAGEGGDAYASLPFNHVDPLNPVLSPLDLIMSYGGANGVGGNGGNISSFTQPVSVDARVDLVAGNGGSTVNYGTSFDDKVGVGKGGSITGITITGHIGNPDPDAVIKAYNNVLGDYRSDISMAEFVESKLRNTAPGDTLTDLDGLVGIVVGAAGSLLNGKPASASLNGSLTGMGVRPTTTIMSAVAGNVDSIAAIQSISGITIATGGIPIPSNLGADKSSGIAPFAASVGMYDYIDPLGVGVNQATPPSVQAGWGLIDGAILARKITGIAGNRIFDLP
jgi:hypothetical protein